MSTGSTFTNLTAALKKRYDDGFIGECTWSKGPLAAMMRKKKWSGSNPVFPLRVGNSPARSATFATSQSKGTDSTYGYTRVKQFALDWYRDYGYATIDGLLLATAGDKMGSFYDQFVAQIDGIMDATMHSYATKLYREGYGQIGAIGASTNLGTTTLQLATVEDVVLYEVGMGLVFGATLTGALRSATPLVVTAINQNLGQLTLSATPNSLAAGITAGDFIFADGDHANGSRTAQAGLLAWLPTTAPSPGENFFGNDRSTDGRMTGVLVDANTNGYSEEEALINGVVESVRYGGKPKDWFFNPTRFGNLQKQAMGRYRPARIEGPAGIGFDGIVLNTPYGEAKVWPDLYCPRDNAFGLDLSTWTTYVAGQATLPNFLTQDGNKILRQTSDDGVECRVGYYATTGCNAPIHNVNLKF